MNQAVSLLDVNILVAICDGHHVHHGAASQWFIENARQGWASCTLTQNGAIRILTQLTKRPVIQVIEQVSGMCASAHHHFWCDDLSILDANTFNHRHLLGHNQITDIWLLALAVKNNGRLVTFDKAISLQAVRGATGKNLVKL